MPSIHYLPMQSFATLSTDLWQESLDAIDGRERRTALLALEPDAAFDLLLSDIELGPGIHGTELAKRAQERFPKLAILLMSGFSAELLDADRDSPPSWELLRKPYSREELASAIARVLGSLGDDA